MGKRIGGNASNLLLFLKDPRAGAFFAVLLLSLHIVNTFLSKNNVMQVPLGLVSTLFVPGYLWLPVISKRAVGTMELVLLSIALSISIVIFSVSIASLALKIPLTGRSVPVILALVSGLGLALRRIFLKRIL